MMRRMNSINTPNLDKDNTARKNAEDDLEKAQEDYNEAVRDLEGDYSRARYGPCDAWIRRWRAEAEAKHEYEISPGWPECRTTSLARSAAEQCQSAGGLC